MSAFPYTFILLRHGESVGNAEGYHQGQADYPLTEKGRSQALALAKRWLSEGVYFDRGISSTLSRARQTAEIIAETLPLSFDYDPIWMERNNGNLAGLKPSEAAVRYPRPAFIHPYLPIGETGETQWELYLRAGRAVQSLLCRPPGRYLVVSHGGLLNMVLYAILGIVPQANFQGTHFRFRNTAYAALSYNPAEHYWVLEHLNERSHWAESGE